MRRLSTFLFGVIFSVGGIGCVGVRFESASAQGVGLYVGGVPAGFTLSANGVQVIGICEVQSEEGIESPALNAGIKVGDVIEKAAGISLDSIRELNEILEKNGTKEMVLTVRRGEETMNIAVCPKKDRVGGRVRIGILIRDSVSGIGTVTYIQKENRRFGALGHAVLGEDHRKLKIAGGEIFPCSIVGATKGVRGRAGELRGVFLNEQEFGSAEKICECGIFGTVSIDYDLNGFTEMQAAKVGEVKIGNAYIYSTVNGICPKKYSIEIVKIDKHNKSNKNYVLKITDKDLIEETGGIVQGMSGSPIVQEGKIVGAVTHVFLNDPTRGYGIDINTMLNE